MKSIPQSIMTYARRNFQYLEDLLKPQKSIEFPPQCKILANKIVSIIEDPLFPTPDFRAFAYGCYEDKATNTRLPLVPITSAQPIGHLKYLVTAAYTSSSGVTVSLPSVWVDLQKPETVVCPKHKGIVTCCPCYAFVPAHASVFRRNNTSYILLWRFHPINFAALIPRPSKHLPSQGNNTFAYYSIPQRAWIIIPPFIAKRSVLEVTISESATLPRAASPEGSFKKFLGSKLVTTGCPADVLPDYPLGKVEPTGLATAAFAEAPASTAATAATGSSIAAPVVLNPATPVNSSQPLPAPPSLPDAPAANLSVQLPGAAAAFSALPSVPLVNIPTWTPAQTATNQTREWTAPSYTDVWSHGSTGLHRPTNRTFWHQQGSQHTPTGATTPQQGFYPSQQEPALSTSVVTSNPCSGSSHSTSWPLAQQGYQQQNPYDYGVPSQHAYQSQQQDATVSRPTGPSASNSDGHSSVPNSGP